MTDDPKKPAWPSAHPEAQQLGKRVAHEINNPAAYVLSNLEFLRNAVADLEVGGEVDDGKLRAMAGAVDDALDGIRRIRAIVRQLGAVPTSSEAPPPSVPRSAFVPRRRCRVLIIDDEVAILRALSRILRADHDVVTVERAELALELFEEAQEFDVVICDLLLPTLTGMDLHREVVARFPSYEPHMVFMTGGAVTPEAARFMSEPSRRTLAKPIDAETLRGIVIEVADEGRGAASRSSEPG